MEKNQERRVLSDPCSEQILKPACCISHTEAAAVSYNEDLSKRVNFPLDREQAGREGVELQARRKRREGNIYSYHIE